MKKREIRIINSAKSRTASSRILKKIPKMRNDVSGSNLRFTSDWHSVVKGEVRSGRNKGGRKSLNHHVYTTNSVRNAGRDRDTPHCHPVLSFSATLWNGGGRTRSSERSAREQLVIMTTITPKSNRSPSIGHCSGSVQSVRNEMTLLT